MFTWLKRAFGIAEADLSKITKKFTTLVDDLEAHINYHQAEADFQAAEIAAATEAKAVAEAAVKKAMAVRANVANLLGL